ncbi:SapC family protein [Thalassospira profundimaris]|uniref:SapC family protein n=1 Tax=Thalassospira profundimaris TaxID=502049 RepID=UPI00215D923D|nr:SapC family protein [Thalassospira profundimaris]
MAKESKTNGAAKKGAAATATGAGPAALPLFYSKPRAVLAERHGNMSLTPTSDFSFAANTNSVPIVATELPMVCKNYPILFTDGAQTQMVALLGLRASENLMVDDKGNWTPGTYVPAYIRRYPFIFFENEEKSQYTLCVDEDAKTVVEGTENPFFVDGEPSKMTQGALDFCRDYQAHYVATAEFLKAIREAGLLVENRADATLADGRKLSLSGFKVIDEAKFNALDDETFLAWRKRGWLHLVYCHFISNGNWNALVERAAMKVAN